MPRVRLFSIMRKHAYRAWVECGGDRDKLAEVLHETAKAARDEAVGFGILAIIVSLLSVIQFVVWLWDRWRKSPPSESDLGDVEAMELCGIAVH